MLDPAGHKTTVPVKIRQIEQDLYRCEYMSTLLGLHSVNVFFAGKPIPNSPFGVKVAPRKIKYFASVELIIYHIHISFRIRC